MKRLMSFFLFWWVVGHLAAQVITTQPAFPSEDQPLVVTFYADRGTKGLKDFAGDIYAHTGVITSKSTSDGDWKYVKAQWSENKPECKLTRVSANVYTLSLSSSVRTYYGVPSGESIQKLAFVFRSADGTKEGKDDGGKDIFAQVYEAELSVAFEQPATSFFYVEAGKTIPVKVNAAFHTEIQLYLDDVLLTTSAASPLNYNLTAPASGKHQMKAVATNGTETEDVQVTFSVHTPTIDQAVPVAGLRRGINRISDTEAYALFFAPYKDFVYLAGDFNQWEPDGIHQMKRDGDYFWLHLTNLNPDQEYVYQYWIDNTLKIADPYTQKVMDPWNDKYIPSATYPGLTYPTGKTDGLAAAFHLNEPAYNWVVDQFEVPAKEKLVIYEVLIRDFTDERNIKTITDTIPYLKRLGVNAIELMPFNEFEGNESWGYNPSFYFAPDKAYGTPADYKKFVDACHQNGMAVIMDMVLNHSYSQSPFAQMYLTDGKPSANNPWYNREHNMTNTAAHWGFDFNHESVHTQQLVDSICSFWMSEYKIDGFRFDFTKGFTNNIKDGSDEWASLYDADRVRLLKRMATEIWKRKADAPVIFEHLSENKEEAELARHGILLWGNLNHNYNEATMGYHESGKSDFGWASYKSRGWSSPNLVMYMESHDEERLMYKNINFGKVDGSYSAKQPEIALRRCEAATAMLIPIPGPVMIWQFGELGYDVSIDDGGRLGIKPTKWDYRNDVNRAHLFEVYRNLIQLKKTEPVFATTDFTLDARYAVKKLELNDNEGTNDIRIVANFDTKVNYAQPGFSATGWWYNHFAGDSIQVSDVNMTIYTMPGKFHLFSKKKMKGFGVVLSDGPDVNKPYAGVRLYPNPASSILSVETGLSGKKTAQILDLTGQVVHQTVTESETFTLPVAILPRGMYVLRIQSVGQLPLIQKFMKR